MPFMSYAFPFSYKFGASIKRHDFPGTKFASIFYLFFVSASRPEKCTIFYVSNKMTKKVQFVESERQYDGYVEYFTPGFVCCLEDVSLKGKRAQISSYPYL